MHSVCAADWSVLWNEDFSNTNVLKNWVGSQGQIVTGLEKGNALHFQQFAPKNSIALRYNLPQEFLGEGELHCTAWIKWKDVSAKPQSWNGVKFMLEVESASGKEWPQCPLEVGSSDWVKGNFTATIPATATNIVLHLGLESVSGEAWFSGLCLKKEGTDLDSISILRRPEREQTHIQDRLRGTMVSPASFTVEDLDTIHAWGANLLRWQLNYTAKSPSDEEYDQWLKASLEKLDRFLPEIAKRDMLIVLDLHSPPGCALGGSGYVTSEGGIWQSQRYQDKFVRIWEEMAKRYQGQPGIWGFDLMNEPVDDNADDAVARWNGRGENQSLVLRTALAVRAIDPERTLIIEPNHWGGVEAMRHFKPLPLANIVYSPHFYTPIEFTHQGVGNRKVGFVYPGVIQGVQWNKDQMRKVLESALRFQQTYNVPIYIGEFSAIRWAPDQSAYRYLKDAIELFEEYGWDWSYHAYREWSGWSVEHSEDKNDQKRVTEPTERQKLLMKYFQKNKHIR